MVLRAAGVENVRILDGGLAAWTASGGPLDRGDVEPEPGDVTVTHEDLYVGAMPTLTADEAAALGPRLGDVRAPERFRGDVEPMDPVAGHIPGAVNLPSMLAADGTVRTDLDGPDVRRVLRVRRHRRGGGGRTGVGGPSGGALPRLVVAVEQRAGTPSGASVARYRRLSFPAPQHSR